MCVVNNRLFIVLLSKKKRQIVALVVVVTCDGVAWWFYDATLLATLEIVLQCDCDGKAAYSYKGRGLLTP